jgi:2-isopropylmalate synthase
VNGDVHSHTAGGEGPVHALDICLRQCLASVYPAITAVNLTDYKVRVLGSKVGTESKVRVLVEWTDHQRSWATVGVSNNVIDASWHALVDALRLELIRLQAGDQSGKATRDYSWAV